MEDELLIRESGTHYTIRLPVEGHDLIVLVDKIDFTITIPYFEYLNVESIVKIIVQLYKNNKDNPVIESFLKLLNNPVNDEELKKFRTIYRSI
jgi:hypothetical protein